MGFRNRADGIDADFNIVAGDDWAYTFGSAGCDQVAGIKGHAGSDVAKDDVQRKNEVASVAALADFAIDAGFDVQACPRVEFIGDDGPDGAEGIETFGARPLTVFILEIARGEIVHTGVAKNVGAHIFALGQACGRSSQ